MAALFGPFSAVGGGYFGLPPGPRYTAPARSQAGGPLEGLAPPFGGVAATGAAALPNVIPGQAAPPAPMGGLASSQRALFGPFSKINLGLSGPMSPRAML